MRLRLVLVLTLGTGTLLAACGVTTSQHVYNQALIKQVGAGSQVEAQLLPTIQAQAKNGLFADPATSQATTYLLEGQLAKLSESDLVRIATATTKAASVTGGIVVSYAKLKSAIRAATVSERSFTGLPSGSKTFIAMWNRYLSSTATTLASIQKVFGSISPIYDELPGLLRAARDTARLQSTVQFDKLRRRVLNDLLPLLEPTQSAVHQGVRNGAAVDRRLADFVNGNQEAQAIVTKVNHDYPNGWLAHQFKASGG